jgi:hypothetical protein
MIRVNERGVCVCIEKQRGLEVDSSIRCVEQGSDRWEPDYRYTLQKGSRSGVRDPDQHG